MAYCVQRSSTAHTRDQTRTRAHRLITSNQTKIQMYLTYKSEYELRIIINITYYVHQYSPYS
jgi:hypothetical protein